MKKRKILKNRNYVLLELWTNPLFKTKKELSEEQKKDKHDPWSRKAKHKWKD